MKLILDSRLSNMMSTFVLALVFISCSWIMEAKGPHDIPLHPKNQSTYSVVQDTIPGKRNIGKYMTQPDQHNPFDLKTPPLLENRVEYDENSNTYNFINQLGEEYGPYAPTMTFSEYLEYRKKQQEQSTRLNSSHVAISYAVFCLKKKK